MGIGIPRGGLWGGLWGIWVGTALPPEVAFSIKHVRSSLIKFYCWAFKLGMKTMMKLVLNSINIQGIISEGA